MAVLRDQPYPGTNFLVDLGTGVTDTPEAGLWEVIFPEALLELQEYRNGNDKTNEPHKSFLMARYGNLVLRRTVNGSLSWYNWWNEVRNGNHSAVRDVTVSLQNEDHTAVVLTWRFLRARPYNHQYSPLTALGEEVFVETLELAFERLEMD